LTTEIIKDGQLWDEFVDQSPYGMLFHKWDFLKTVEKHTGYELRSYGIYKGEKLIGIFPLFFKRSHSIKMLFSPPPRTGIYYLGFILSKDYDGQKQSKKEGELGYFSDEMEKQIEELAPDYLLINAVPNFLDSRYFKWNNYTVEPNYTYVIDLSRPVEEIWGGFNRYLRKDIKSAEVAGLSLGLAEDVSAFYSMQSRRYEEQGLVDPLVGKDYLKDLFEAYPDYIKMYYIYDKGGSIISAFTTLEYKERFQGWMGLIKTIGHANEFLIWNMIQYSLAKNFKKFEIIGANVKNQCPFKSKFNPNLEMNYIISKKNIRGNMAEWAYLNLIKNKKVDKLKE
jgi:hypothetical protein